MIPEDIILNILSRLPAKSIGRFRSVSKPWRSLLSHPYFIKSHFHQTLHDEVSLLLVSRFYTLYSLKLTNDTINLSPILPALSPILFLDGHYFSSRDVNVDKMSSCDGLILLKNEQDKLLLLNPTTEEFQVLPTSPFALDRSVSCTLEGVGYDHVTDDYKVVTLSYYDHHNYKDYDVNDPNCTGIFINVYSVKNGTWKTCRTSPYDHVNCYPSCGVFVNGRIHWRARKDEHNSVIAAFDLGEERFYDVPPPSWVDGDVENFVFYRLVELGGCLSMCPFYGSNRNDVWIMKEYGVGESWTKFTVTDVDDKLEFRPLWMLGKEQMVVLMDLYNVFLTKFNLKEGTFEDIDFHDICKFFVRGAFKESLVSPLALDLQE